MTNHYHLVVETPEGNLSQGMRQLNGMYTQASNRKHQRTGHLFQGRFKGILVDKDSYLLELSRYVVLNPVRAGMVKTPGKYAWSSYRAMLGDAPTPKWLATDGLLSQFSSRRAEARRRYAQFVTDGITGPSIWGKLQQQIYLGDEKFIQRMQKRASLPDDDLSIPKAQRRGPAPSLKAIEAKYRNREKAIMAAYATGAYSYREIAAHFGIHLATVGRLVRRAMLQGETPVFRTSGKPPFPFPAPKTDQVAGESRLCARRSGMGGGLGGPLYRFCECLEKKGPPLFHQSGHGNRPSCPGCRQGGVVVRGAYNFKLDNGLGIVFPTVMNAEHSSDTPSSQGIVAQAEELYENYLNARLQRSVRALQAIKMSLARDVANASLIGQMREATREIETLRNQIAAQAGRTEEARRRAFEAAKDAGAVSAGAVSETPDAVFRESQAAAAAAVMEARAREAAEAAAQTPVPDALFNAAQAERAKQALEAAGKDARRCPKCRATMTPNGSCLACGYSVPAAPGAVDFISKEEIAALRRPPAGR